MKVTWYIIRDNHIVSDGADGLVPQSNQQGCLGCPALLHIDALAYYDDDILVVSSHKRAPHVVDTMLFVFPSSEPSPDDARTLSSY